MTEPVLMLALVRAGVSNRVTPIVLQPEVEAALVALGWTPPRDLGDDRG